MKKKTMVIVIAVTVFVAAGVFYFKRQQKQKAPQWTELRLTKANINVVAQASGTVLPENRVEIKSAISGRVDRVVVNEGQKVRKGQVLAWMSSTERAVLLDSARAQGDDELARWEELYKPTAIIAPVTGMIILRNVESGQTIASSDAILVMSDRLIVKAQVDETDLARIKNGQKAEVILDAYSKEPIEAIVDKIAFEAKTVNNVTTYSVVLVPQKVPEYMRSGMTTTVRFLLSRAVDVWTLPVEAVEVIDGKSTVRIKKDAKQPFELKSIQTGLSDGKNVEIKSGISESDTVLSEVYSADNLNAKDQPKSFFSNATSGRRRGGR